VLAAEARRERARQRLNALVGLPPGFELELTLEEDPAARPALETPVEQLTAHAVTARPDLAERLAAYAVAEQELRLAVSQQYPLVAVGTGLSLVPGLMSRFGRPAIDTALARREQLRLEVEARVHAVRREVAAARARWDTARRELELVETDLLPSAEGSLELSRVALEAGEVTLLESLALQRALVEARTRHTAARIQVSTSAWELLSASGLLLPPPPLATADRGTDPATPSEELPR
jgi:outer membrane protein TolC